MRSRSHSGSHFGPSSPRAILSRRPRSGVRDLEDTEIVQATPSLHTNPEARRTHKRTAIGSGGAPIYSWWLSVVVSCPIGSAGFLVASSEGWSDFAFTPRARLQVWRSELTLTLEGAEARSWWRQGGAGGPGRPRPRPDPSHIPSSSPPLTILTSVLAACADQRTCCSLCDGGGLGTVAHLRGGATGLPFAAARLHSRRKSCMFLLVGVCILARSEISKSSVRAKWGNRQTLTWVPPS